MKKTLLLFLLGITLVLLTTCENPWEKKILDPLFKNKNDSSSEEVFLFTSVAAFRTWLTSQSANSPSGSYKVKLNIPNSEIADVKAALNDPANVSKYVYIDLSGSSVTSIGASVFYSCPTLTGITLPDSVGSIGYNAFAYCTSLTSINMGNGVTSIGNYAFDICTSLISVIIPNSVTSIGDGAFSNCQALASLIISNSITSIVQYTFNGCMSLTSVSIPNSVASIGYFAFNDCYGLVNVTFNSGTITSIDSNAFLGNLETVYFGGGGQGTYTTTGPVNASSTWMKL